MRESCESFAYPLLHFRYDGGWQRCETRRRREGGPSDGRLFAGRVARNAPFGSSFSHGCFSFVRWFAAKAKGQSVVCKEPESAHEPEVKGARDSPFRMVQSGSLVSFFLLLSPRRQYARCGPKLLGLSPSTSGRAQVPW
jgi:hypothetical protein